MLESIVSVLSPDLIGLHCLGGPGFSKRAVRMKINTDYKRRTCKI